MIIKIIKECHKNVNILVKPWIALLERIMLNIEPNAVNNIKIENLLAESFNGPGNILVNNLVIFNLLSLPLFENSWINNANIIIPNNKNANIFKTSQKYTIVVAPAREPKYIIKYIANIKIIIAQNILEIILFLSINARNPSKIDLKITIKNIIGIKKGNGFIIFYL